MCPPSSYLLAFDLEIAKIIPDGTEDWSQYRPYGISVAATLTDDGGLRLWHGGPGPDGNPWPQMSSMQAQVFVRYLLRMVGQGYTIVSWNGLGFDFDVLAEESGLHEECKDLALNHIDPMFHLFCERGFALSLNKVAHGMGLSGKTEGMNGALAPVLWAEGRYQEVMDYVAQDARTTLEVFQAAQKHGYLSWISRAGRRQIWRPAAGRWLTVREAMDLPLPDTSWMTNPWPREKFTGWLRLNSKC